MLVDQLYHSAMKDIFMIGRIYKFKDWNSEIAQHVAEAYFSGDKTQYYVTITKI